MFTQTTRLAFTLLWAAVIGQGSSATQPSTATSSSTNGRETVLDRVVYIHTGLIREIPKVPPYCDSLKLSKRRVNVGDCELYYEQEGDGLPLVLLHGGPGATHHYFHPSFTQAGSFAKVINRKIVDQSR